METGRRGSIFAEAEGVMVLEGMSAPGVEIAPTRVEEAAAAGGGR